MLIPSTRLIFFIFFSRSSSLESAIFGVSVSVMRALACPVSLSLSVFPLPGPAAVLPDNVDTAGLCSISKTASGLALGGCHQNILTAVPPCLSRSCHSLPPAMTLFCHPTLPTLPLIGLLLLSRDHRRVLGFAVGSGSGSLRQVATSSQEMCLDDVIVVWDRVDPREHTSCAAPRTLFLCCAVEITAVD